MCQLFTVGACSTITGALVSVFDHQGGTLLASGVTALISGGATEVYLTWSGKPGNYYVTATKSGFVDFSQTLNLKCSGHTSIELIYSAYPDRNYACAQPCTDPAIPVPLVTMTFNWSGMKLGIGSMPIKFNQGVSQCTATGGTLNGSLKAIFDTTSESLDLQVTYYSDGACVHSAGSYFNTLGCFGGNLTISSYTVTPFTVTYQSRIDDTKFVITNP